MNQFQGVPGPSQDDFNSLSEQIGTVASQLGTITTFDEQVTIDEVTYFVMGVQYTAFNGRMFKIGVSLATETSNRLFVYNGFLAKWETVNLTPIS